MKNQLPDFLMVEPVRPGHASPVDKPTPLVTLWVLRMLVKLGGHKHFIDPGMWNDEDLAASLDLPVVPPEESDDAARAFPRQALALLKKRHAQAEKAARHLPTARPDTLAQNAQRLALHLGLSDVDREILAFVVSLHSEPTLEAAANCLGDLTTSRVHATLATILDLDQHAVREALSRHGKLCNSGIITICPIIRTDLKNKLDILSNEFSDRMVSSAQDPIDLIRDTVRPAKPTSLALADYAHLGKDLTLLRHYLDEALNQQRRGVNILVYGPPGTGKSELARLVAATCNAPLFEVAAEDADGDPVEGGVRLRSYRAAMSFFANHRAVVLFDEAEDIFNDGGMFSRSTADRRKAWLNRMLEESPVPTIWLSNSGQGIDPAFIRRYDLTFKLDIAPTQRRKEILEDLAGQYLSKADVERAARSEQLAPAVISRATAVLDTIRERLPQEEWSASLLHLLDNTLETQGHGRLPHNAPTLPAYYDPALLNTDARLDEITRGLRQLPAARLCLYGPPGTGKTAFGHWLATTLERPLLVKRASDLSSMWVGETEKNIAAAFREASDSGAILLVDEVDGFLADRRRAQQSWEVTAVNEMLTQLESFEGLFIASTNLMDGLDQAALRRFDLKVKFDYLQAGQAWEMLCAQCEAFGIPAPGRTDHDRLQSLRVLTPGDFAVVARRNRLSPCKSAAEVVEQLRREVELKEEGRPGKAIGFLS